MLPSTGSLKERRALAVSVCAALSRIWIAAWVASELRNSSSSLSSSVPTGIVLILSDSLLKLSADLTSKWRAASSCSALKVAPDRACNNSGAMFKRAAMSLSASSPSTPRFSASICLANTLLVASIILSMSSGAWMLFRLKSIPMAGVSAPDKNLIVCSSLAGTINTPGTASSNSWGCAAAWIAACICSGVAGGKGCTAGA